MGMSRVKQRADSASQHFVSKRTVCLSTSALAKCNIYQKAVLSGELTKPQGHCHCAVVTAIAFLFFNAWCKSFDIRVESLVVGGLSRRQSTAFRNGFKVFNLRQHRAMSLSLAAK
jgi:hypothetical protein